MQSPISTSPVGRFGFTVPSGRGPHGAGDAHDVLGCAGRARRARRTARCPVWSRRSTKARCSPCSRRRATQPHTDHRASGVAGAQRRRTVGSVRGLHAQRRLPHVVDDLCRGDRLLAWLAFGTGVPQARTVTSPTPPRPIADDQRERRPGAVGRLHLRLHAAPSKARSAAMPAARSSCVSTSACVAAGRCRRRTRRPSTSGAPKHALGVARQQDALDAGAEPDAGRAAAHRAARRGRRSDRRRRSRSAPSRARRRANSNVVRV